MMTNEAYKFLGLFAASVAVNYFIPAEISQFFFWGLLFLFAICKNNKMHFWLVLFWLLFTSPGYLFYDLGVYKLPSINITSMDREIFYSEVFGIIAVLKAVIRPEQQQRIFYYKPLLFIVGYAVFLLLYGAFLGSSILTVLKSIRYFIPLLLLLFIPRLLPYNQIPNAIKLMFVCVFILVFTQGFDIMMGYPLATVLGETQLMFSGSEVSANFSVFDVTRGAVRTIYGPFILVISLVISLFLLQSKNILFKSNYLILVVLLASLSIFMSATRGWILAVVLILGTYAMINLKKFMKVALIALVLMIVVLSIPNINMQITGAFERALTLDLLVKGDLTAGGTLSRLTDRGPRVMNKFYQSPVFGFGFSEEFYEYQDGHVGNQNLLLNGGIVGYGIFLFFIIFILKTFVYRYEKSRVKDPLIFLFGLLGLIIIHSTSAMVFAYALMVQSAIALGLFFFVSDYFCKIDCGETHASTN